MLTLAQLIRTPSITEARQFMIDLLVGAGFKTAASWQSGTYARTFGIELPALLLNDGSLSIYNIARGFFNDLAQGEWLTLYSLSAYDNLRKEAVRASGPATLTSTSFAPPYTIGVGYLVATNGQGIAFRNTTGGTLSPSSTLELEWEAEIAGAAANSVQPGQLTNLQTTLAGVTINNPGSGGEWLTQLGTDEESDEALRLRNKTKWATRATHAPEEAYQNWALEAATEITRAKVDSQNPEGPGTLRIYIAGAEGTVPSLLEDVVVDYINGDGPDGIVRRAIGAEVYCSAAATKAVTITGTIYQAAAYAYAVQSDVEANLASFEEALPIGGTQLDPGDPGKLLRASLYGAIMKVTGVMNADIQAPADDVELLPNEVVDFTLDLTYVTV